MREINVIQRVVGLTASIKRTQRTRKASTFNDSAVDESGSPVNFCRKAVYRLKKKANTNSNNNHSTLSATEIWSERVNWIA